MTTPFPCHSMTLPSPALRILEHLRLVPERTQSGLRLPFARAGVPSVDLIDFTFPCWHKSCDDLSAVSATSLDVVGETVADVLRGF